MNLRLATPDDFRGFFDRPEPECWFGLAAVEGEKIVGMGTVTWRWECRDEPRLRCWASFDAKHPIPVVTMHRLATKTLAFLAKDGEPEIHAFCNSGIPGAERWLLRLGFDYDPSMTIDYGETVWTRRLADG